MQTQFIKIHLVLFVTEGGRVGKHYHVSGGQVYTQKMGQKSWMWITGEMGGRGEKHY